MTGSPTETSPGGGTPWYQGADAETTNYITARGWDKKPAPEAALEAAKAHRSLQQLQGRLSGVPEDRILIRPADGDVAGTEAFYKALGRPVDAAGYELPETAAPWAAKAFEQGLTPAQAKAMAEFHTAEVARVTTERDTDTKAARTLSGQKLEADWGTNAPEFLAIARRGMAASGLTVEDIAAMEQTTSYDKVMNHFLQLGRMTDEGRFLGGSTPRTDGVLSATEAQTQKEALMGNPEFMKDFKDNKEKQMRLNRLDQVIVAAWMRPYQNQPLPSGGYVEFGL